jgi:hypothetical protein
LDPEVFVAFFHVGDVVERGLVMELGPATGDTKAGVMVCEAWGLAALTNRHTERDNDMDIVKMIDTKFS